MINTKKLFGQCLLAAALAGSALSAFAGTTNYHVAVNTSGLSGTGWLDLYLASGNTALPLTATLSNFSADFGAVNTAWSGDYSVGPNGSYTLTNGAGFNDLTRFLNLGGTVGFDVAFSGDFIDTAGTEGGLFTVGLYDANGNGFGDPFLGVASFSLAATSPTAYTIVTQPGLATVGPVSASPVPEPSALMLMLTGLGLAGFVGRRRSAAGVR